MPKGWCTIKLESLCKSIASKKYQIKQSAVKSNGKYPVISQSANFIEGYSEDEDKLYSPPKPVVVFGDHTRIVKYIDFPFIVGADGVKILQPLLSERYFYLLVQYVATHIRDRGYGRHYGYLSQHIVPIPPEKEQERIIEHLEGIFKAIDEISAEL